MSHLPIAPDVSLAANRQEMAGSCPDDFGEHCSTALKSYLECRCRGRSLPRILVGGMESFL